MKAGLFHPRRGVLLLLVLGLLALFALVAVAFVIISGQSQRSSKIMQRMDQTQNDPQRQLNEAMMQVARGPSNPCSMMGLHSLLEDMYGNTSRLGAVVNNSSYPYSSIAGGQLIQIAVPLPVPSSIRGNVSGTPLVSPLNWCSGMVITFLNGPRTMGHSTRVVAHIPANTAVSPATPDFLQIVASETIDYDNIAADLADLNGESLYYLINAPPFCGTGFGFNPGTGKMDLSYVLDPGNTNPAYRQCLSTNPASLSLSVNGTTFNAALLPNMPITAYSGCPDPLIANAPVIPPGGANEDYDAADYQNMVLGTPTIGGMTIPSLHRPALVNYWYNELVTDPSARDYEATFWNSTGLNASQKLSYLQNPSALGDAVAHQNIIDFKRRIILRPSAEDNPDFTGSNPTVVSTPPWNPISGPWDVDNDGDGIADSIWVDLGFPVRSSKEGKLFKPLFAILCVDMDGRVNLNAHGNLTQAGQPIETPSTFTANYFAGSALPTIAGRGFGPAEINLSAVLPTSPINLYEPILVGNGTYEGRYGADQRPGTAGSADFSKLGNAANLLAPGVSSYNDYLSANKWFQFDGLYQNSATKPASPLNVKGLASRKGYGELPDPQGIGATGVDPAGRPILQNLWIQDPANPSNLIPSNFLDRPYELNLGLKTSRSLPGQSGTPDNPFSVNELERILRPFDRDAMTLPDRLAKLTSPTGAASNSVLISKRNEVTTESWDVPALVPGLPPHILDRVRVDLAADTTHTLINHISWVPPHSVTDLLKAYYYYQLVTTGGMASIAAADKAESMVNRMTAAQLLQLFPPEMLAGLKMNINRPLPGPGSGSATDTNAFGKVALWQSLGAGGSYGDFWFGQMPEFPDGNADVGYYFPGVDATHIDAVQFPARQLYARYLYVLALLLRDRAPDGRAQWFTEDVTGHEDELMKRRIAQWAINAVCFRTSDSTMAPFEYDADPFTYHADPADPSKLVAGGWQVDGVIGTNPSTGGINDDSNAYRGLVWGCKPPELLLTETLAFHDRRIADTRWDNDPKKKTTDRANPPWTAPYDDDYDQTRIPQGSAFFELYCPRDLHGSTPPLDLYNSNGQLDLGRLAPADVNARQYPVWRLVIGANNTANPRNNALSRFGTPTIPGNPDTFVPQTQQYSDAPLYMKRTPTSDESTLLETHTAAATPITIDRIVWFASLQPITKSASATDYHADADRIYYNYAGTSTQLDRGHYAVIGPRMTTVLGLNSDTSDAANYPLGKPSSQKITIPAPSSLQVTDINGTPDANIDSNKIKMPLGMIVGNTPAGWSTPVGVSVSEPLFSSSSYYPQPTVAGTGLYEVRDIYGSVVKEWYGDPTMKDPAVGYFPNTPIESPNPVSIDPNRPLQNTSESLPYTGTQPNYKTIFLQRLANPSAAYDPATNPYLTVDWMPIDLTIFVGECDDTDATGAQDLDRQYRSSKPTNFATRQRGNATADYNIWAPKSDDPNNSSQAGSTAYFDYDLKDHDSLGYLNKNFQPFMSPVSPEELRGDPSTQPFPWLPWSGRPYVNQLELMLVPASSPARLLWEFRPCSATTNDYAPADATQAPFPELLNFIQAGNGNGMNQFGRVLDYVAVPSWFAGTELQVNPTYAAAAAPGSHTFFPPYNSISTYREPGRINLNTVYTQDVFNGLMNGAAPPTLSQLSTSRGDKFPVMNVAYPTEVAHPFRSSGGGAMVPRLDDPGGATGPLGLDYLKPNYEIDASYMRRDATVSTKPLFQYTSTNPVDNTDRNPFFHYQELERLGNLVTTRSNVYAVWITVGYFEVKPNRLTTPAGLPDAGHPDGYELGQELGSDTGEIVRHRAFYMIDRTIPVGFQRGQDVNVEKAIILKRFIE
jgi:hypothetical protein